MSRKYKPLCVTCGAPFSPARRAVGYHVCLPCGEAQSKQVRHTIVPMHKSNYVPITDRADLIGINNKGGFAR